MGALQLKLYILMVMLGLCQCRTAEVRDSDARLTEREWYGQNGEVGLCEPPETNCPDRQDESQFVDQCVKAGHQAKSCGCSVRCSGKVALGVGQTAVHALHAAGSAEVSSQQATACKSEVITRAVARRKPGSSLDRCLEAMACQGQKGLCDGDDLTVATSLRNEARRGCRSEVYHEICPQGYGETLGCSDEKVVAISAAWSDVTEARIKQCYRSVVCDVQSGPCSDEILEKARNFDLLVKSPGCQYWLGVICQFGANSR